MIFRVVWSNGNRSELYAKTLRELDDFVGEQFAAGNDVDLRPTKKGLTLYVAESRSRSRRG
jgi:hypothetical protein